MHGAPDAVAVSSCTAALHLILLALESARETRSSLPSITFAATVNAVLYVAPRPSWWTSQPRSPDPRAGRRRGQMHGPHAGGDRDALRRLRHGPRRVARARAAPQLRHRRRRRPRRRRSRGRDLRGCHRLLVLRQQEHEHGRGRHDPRRGSQAPRPDAARPCARADIRNLRAQACPAPTYDVVSLGYNYRSTSFRAAIASRSSTSSAPETARRRAHTEAYFAALTAQAPRVGLPFHRLRTIRGRLPPTTSCRCCCRRQRPRCDCRFLSEAGIQTTMHYPPAHRMTFYRSFPARAGPARVTEAVPALQQITLPPSIRMSEVRRRPRGAATLADALTPRRTGG